VKNARMTLPQLRAAGGLIVRGHRFRSDRNQNCDFHASTNLQRLIRLLLIQEHWLKTGSLIHLPAIPKWSDFDDRHGKIAFSSDRRYLFA